jgi:uncharacterized coiled-coil DUF342 family protein
MSIQTEHTTQLDAMKEVLLQIQEFMEKELELKNESINRQSKTIDSLLQQREELKRQLIASQNELKDIRQQAEGKKELVNKLLGDIARLQQDVDWYRRTYEERSFWGTIKEKLARKRDVDK